jgi:hypothetical protein
LPFATETTVRRGSVSIVDLAACTERSFDPPAGAASKGGAASTSNGWDSPALNAGVGAGASDDPSLVGLGNVFAALAARSASVPFKESKLAHVLQVPRDRVCFFGARFGGTRVHLLDYVFLLPDSTITVAAALRLCSILSFAPSSSPILVFRHHARTA